MIWSVRLLKWKLDGEYETKSFQDYNDGEFVCINIRGKKFIVLRENFERFPDTRLGKLVVKCCNFQLMVLVVRSGVELLSRGWGTATDTLRKTHRNSSSTCRLTVIDGWFSSWKTASFFLWILDWYRGWWLRLLYASKMMDRCIFTLFCAELQARSQISFPSLVIEWIDLSIRPKSDFPDLLIEMFYFPAGAGRDLMTSWMCTGNKTSV